MKICCNVCNKYKKYKNPKISNNLKKTLDLSFDLSLDLKILGLITNVEEYQKLYNHVSRKHKSKI